MHGHFHNAIYRRPEKKVSLSFRAGTDSFHSISNPGCGISNSTNHLFSRPLARPFKCWVSSHSIFLRFWSRRLLGNRFRSQSSETFLSSRSSYGFHFLRNRGRAGVYGNYGDHSLIFNFNLAGFCNSLSGQRSIWNPFGNRPNSFDRISSFYKSGSSSRASSNQGINSSLYQHGRIIHVDHHAFGGCSVKYFRSEGETLTKT